MRKILFVPILLTLTLSGCFGWLTKDQPTNERVVFLNAARPAAVELADPEWDILTPENQSEKFNSLEEDKVDQAFFCLRDSSYEDIAKNMEKLQSHILELHDTVDAYKDYYESNENNIKGGTQ